MRLSLIIPLFDCCTNCIQLIIMYLCTIALYSLKRQEFNLAAIVCYVNRLNGVVLLVFQLLISTQYLEYRFASLCCAGNNVSCKSS